ncbi:MAG: O-antigen ligase family protein [Lamprobacter sp.]|uniref:O-antigen ligase family protein n=1 Tax=Lamprobacter sp. TaxID=3100796 RepID=UPI002B25A16E|nr:O-antigen ligase family protein [Lamprobacter sp.]MEA3641106.1 O-antigen ligase family protein [Lamprobacter sp.]
MVDAAVLGAARVDRSAPVRGLPFWILTGVLVFSPLPLASVAPVWPALYGVLLAFAIWLYLLQRWRLRRAIPLPPLAVVAASGLLLGVTLWGFVQSLPGVAPGWQHPVWAQTATLLEMPELEGALSLVPERSVEVATHYLTYLAFAWLAFWCSRRGRNQDLLLKVFIATQAAYAAYGLVVYFAGTETILWFDKDAYLGVLTSTFINRNSYATYAGLGTLAALALILRYLRRLLMSDSDGDSDARSRLRDFVETFTVSGWPVAMAVLLCFLALLLTESRMGLIAFLAGVAVLLLGWSLRLPAGRPRAVGLGLVSLPLALLALNLFLSGDQTAARFEYLFERGDGRFEVYPLIQQAIAERPWTGYGLGSFESAFSLFRDETVPFLYRRAHSDYLELAMEIGWPATLVLVGAFVLMLVSALMAAIQRQEFELALLFVAATVQIGLHSLVDFSMQMPAVVFAYLLLAGLAFGSSARTRV